MNILRSFARPMLAAPFIVDGLDALVRPSRHVEKFEKVAPTLERVGLPPVLTSDARLLTRASGAVSLVAGLGLAAGRAPRTNATILAALNVPLTVVNNPVWAVKGTQARKETLSGLLRGAALGPGSRWPPSIVRAGRHWPGRCATPASSVRRCRPPSRPSSSAT